MEERIDRAILLMEIAAEYIEDFWPDGIVTYDDAECDGYCLAEDLKCAASALMERKL